MNDASKAAMRQRLLIATALAILGLYAILSVFDARDAAERLALAQQDLTEIKQKLSEIELLSEAPSIAALDTEPSGAIIDRIEAALKQAGMPPSGKVSQTTSEPSRIPGTQYQERKTEIKLAASTLPKIVGFCDALRDEETGSVVGDLKLTAPRNGGGNARQEAWEATLTLTQTIYSPKSG